MWSDWYWLLWAAPAFLGVELIRALDHKPGGTFSEWVWQIFAIDLKKRKWGFVRRWSLAGLMVALTLHFLFKASVLPVIIFGGLVGLWIYYWFRYER